MDDRIKRDGDGYELHVPDNFHLLCLMEPSVGDFVEVYDPHKECFVMGRVSGREGTYLYVGTVAIHTLNGWIDTKAKIIRRA